MFTHQVTVDSLDIFPSHTPMLDSDFANTVPDIHHVTHYTSLLTAFGSVCYTITKRIFLANKNYTLPGKNALLIAVHTKPVNQIFCLTEKKPC